LSFQFWGNEFIIRSELSFNADNIFNKWELNTYYIHFKREKLLFSHFFDDFGYIGFDRGQYNCYTEFYISELFNKVVEFSGKHSVKFPLK